jgi:hypothetical protein
VSGLYGAALAGSAPAADGAAEGPKRKLAVAPIAVEGKLADAARGDLEKRLAEALERAGFEVVHEHEALASTPCDSAQCVVEVTRATETTHLVQVFIVQEGRDYDVRTVVWTARDGSETATVKQTCEICGLAELGDLVAAEGASLTDKLTVVPGRLVVATRPEGALVRIGDRLLGESPIAETLAPGTYTVSVEKSGFHSRQREVTLVEGGEETVDFELQVDRVAVRKKAEAEASKRSALRVAGWATFGIGMGTLAGAIAPLVLHERPVERRCTPENIGENGVCKFRYDTVGIGAALAGVGGALVVTGVALLAAHARQRRKGGARKADRVRVRPAAGGLAVSF